MIQRIRTDDRMIGERPTVAMGMLYFSPHVLGKGHARICGWFIAGKGVTFDAGNENLVYFASGSEFGMLDFGYTSEPWTNRQVSSHTTIGYHNYRGHLRYLASSSILLYPSHTSCDDWVEDDVPNE